ncbi:MAG TPA: NAD(P)H-dependent oxidoreductase [Rhizomicrobium sp.]|nr:NAD(P)H-dependent oxidoreductase [Rhizomicrobium sp.]
MRILLIDGHPDPRPERLCHAVADAYVAGARSAGHDVRRTDIGTMEIPFLRRVEDFHERPAEPAIRKAQDDIAWAEHIVFVHPLWVGSQPALLRAFMEQVARGGFAFDTGTAGDPRRGLSGKSARLIVTMGMPALAFRLLFGAFGVRAFARGALRLAGARPVRSTFFGAVELSQDRNAAFIKKVRTLGERGL